MLSLTVPSYIPAPSLAGSAENFVFTMHNPVKFKKYTVAQLNCAGLRCRQYICPETTPRPEFTGAGNPVEVDMPGWTPCSEILKRDSPEEPGLLGAWTCTVTGVEGDDITVIYCDKKKGTAKRHQFLVKPVPGMVTIANNVQPESDYFTDGDDEDDLDDFSDYAPEGYDREDDDVQPSAEGNQAPGPKEKKKKGNNKVSQGHQEAQQ